MKKPTYTDIAGRAGVGTATVERVLNGRGGVSEATAERVVRAARALDWGGRLPEKHRGLVRIEAILVRSDTSFFARLSAAFRRIAATLDPMIQLHVTFIEEADAGAIAERIDKPPVRRAALAIAAPDHPLVRTALSRAHVAGLPIVQIVSRAIAGADFVGIDNYAAGRMAAMLTSRLGAVSGTVVALCHSQVYRVHRDRLRGFSDYLAQHPRPDLAFRFVAFGRDDRADSARRVREALGNWPDLAGFYNAGGANTTVLDVLGRSARKVFFVGHELNDLTRDALRDGRADVILDQLPEAQARRAVDILLLRLGLLDAEVDRAPIRFATITAENL